MTAENPELKNILENYYNNFVEASHQNSWVTTYSQMLPKGDVEKVDLKHLYQNDPDFKMLCDKNFTKHLEDFASGNSILIQNVKNYSEAESKIKEFDTQINPAKTLTNYISEKLHAKIMNEDAAHMPAGIHIKDQLDRFNRKETINNSQFSKRDGTKEIELIKLFQVRKIKDIGSDFNPN